MGEFRVCGPSLFLFLPTIKDPSWETVNGGEEEESKPLTVRFGCWVTTMGWYKAGSGGWVSDHVVLGSSGFSRSRPVSSLQAESGKTKLDYRRRHVN